MRFIVLVEGGKVEVCFEELAPAERGFTGVDAEFADADFGFVVFGGDFGGEHGSLSVRGYFIWRVNRVILLLSLEPWVSAKIPSLKRLIICIEVFTWSHESSGLVSRLPIQ